MTYNLLDEKWIPVLYRDGRWERVGIRKALEEAAKIRQIAASNPMDRVAILRFLLAILYWCKGNPPDKSGALSGGSFPRDWFSKLDKNKDYFNLLGEGKRFYQCHVVEPCKDEDKEHEVIPLIHEIPNGDDKWHFRHSTDKVNGLCQACCALGLLRLPLFTTGEGRGWHQGINGTPPIYVLSLGRTLAETLRANWVPQADLGEPAWLQPDIRPTPGLGVLLLTGLTLLPRRVWLHNPVKETDMCIACGSIGASIIKTCEYQSSGPLQNERWNDPHVLYSRETPRKVSKAPDLTAAGKFRMDRPWPDLLARMVQAGKFGLGDRPTSFLVVGFATHQAKNIDVWERTIAMPPGTSITEESRSLPQQWRKEGWRLEKRIGRSEDEGAAMIAAVRPHVEEKVSAKAGELIAGTDEAWQQAATEYRPMMDVVAKSLSPGFAVAALERRRHIAGVMPEMRPKTESAKKPKGKKGGGK